MNFVQESKNKMQKFIYELKKSTQLVAKRRMQQSKIRKDKGVLRKVFPRRKTWAIQNVLRLGFLTTLQTTNREQALKKILPVP